jgi:hypothetical protein
MTYTAAGYIRITTNTTFRATGLQSGDIRCSRKTTSPTT